MEKTLWKSHWWAYAQTNWLKIVVFGILCFIFLKKDLTFQLNLNAPLKVEESVDEHQPDLKSRKSKSEKLTDKTTVLSSVTTNKSGFLDNLSFNETEVEVQEKPVVDFQPVGEIDEWTITNYIERFSHVAITEQERFQIPASIILANAIFHSFAGQSEITRKGKNHFGIKCTNDWNGKSIKQSGNCYRKYNSAWESFRDHSRYLSQGKFKKLKKYELTDYKSWAKGLEKLKYGEQLKMSYQLIQLIEQHKLYQFDLAGI